MNHPHSLVILVTLAALILCLVMGMSVSAIRRRHGLPPPAMTGHEAVERALRVHNNTLEWLPLFLLPLWFFALYFGDYLAAALGVIWIIGRAIYWAGYMRSPGARLPGFGIQAVAVLVLLVGSIFGALRALVTIGA